jgi:Glycosyl hydrolase family 26
MFAPRSLSHARHARPRPGSVRLRRTPSLVVVCTLEAVALLVGAFIYASPSDAAGTKMIVGVVGDSSTMSKSMGSSLPMHIYGQLTGPVPTAAMVNMRAAGVSWKTVAAAQPGSTVYTNILRWATTLKSRGGSIMFAFHHEPEASGSTSYGTSADFVAAYRRVVTIFRSAGATNVKFVWQMTSYAFVVGPNDARSAAKWYPGDSYIDYVGADPYNFYNCGPGRNVWKDLSAVADKALAFTKAHGKELVLAEFASQKDSASASRRAQWLTNAHTWIAANHSSIRAVFYFQAAHRAACYFPLSTTAEMNAYTALAKDASLTS